MQPMSYPLVRALALAAAFGGNALAQGAPPSAEQAKALEAQIHDALVSATDGAVPISPRPVELTPEGDHYLVRVPLGQWGGVEPADAAFTAQARQIGGTLWSLDNQRFPSDFKVTAMVTVPDGSGPGPGGKHKEAATYAVKLGQQDAHGLFDPSFATPTTSEGTIGGVDILRAGASAAGVTHIGRLVSQTTLHPVDPAHVDLLSDTTAEAYATESSMPDGSTFKMTAAAVHIVSGLSGLAHDRLLPLVHQAIATARLRAAPDDAQAQAAIASGLRQTIAAAKDLLTGGRIEESATDLKFDVGGHVGSMAKVDFLFSGDAPQDMLTATLGFSLDGLVLDDLPPALAAYVPSHVGIRPTLSNLSVADLTAMATDAANAGTGTVPTPDLQALFAHGGINVGFDSFGLDIAGTQFAGVGKFTVTGPQTVAGVAEITAHGLDALIVKVQADPLLARGVPVIIFLKGIAHINGDQAVWQVTVANQKVLVNGVDLSAMASALP